MVRTRILVNDDTSDWVLSQFGGIIVPAGGSLDITDLISDAEIGNAINDNGLILSAVHKLRIDTVLGDLDIVDSSDYQISLTAQLEQMSVKDQDFDSIQDLTVSSTTSTSFVDKLELNFAPVMVGLYVLSAFCEIAKAGSTGHVKIRIVEDSTTIIDTGEFSGGTLSVGFASNRRIEFTDTVSRSYKLQFASPNGDTVYIRHACLFVQRVKNA